MWIFFILNIVLAQQQYYFGGGCGLVDDTIYYMGGKQNEQMFTDVLSLSLSGSFKTDNNSWQLINLRNQYEALYPNVIERGKPYKDIYFMGGKELKGDNFDFFNPEKQVVEVDSKSNLLIDNNIIFPYLSTWDRNPTDTDKSILYGGYLNTTDYDMFIYSDNQRAWTNIKTNLVNDTRLDHTSTTYNDNIYYLGGRYKNNTLINMDHLLLLNTTNNQLNKINLLGDIPKPRLGAKLIVLDTNELLLIGGVEDINFKISSNQVYSLNMINKRWTQLNVDKNLLNNIGYRACAINKYPYLIFSFGYNNNNNNTILLFNQNTLSFTNEYIPVTSTMTTETNKLPLYIILIISISSFIVVLIVVSISVFLIRRKNDSKLNEKEKWVAPDPLWEPTITNNELQFQQHLFTLQPTKSTRNSNTLINDIDSDDKALPNPLDNSSQKS